MAKLKWLALAAVAATACGGDRYDGPNRAPLAAGGGDRRGRMWQPQVLDASGSRDPDGDALTFAWKLLSAPQGSTAVLTDAATPRATLVPDREGEYRARVTVRDGELATDDEVRLTIGYGPPPGHVGVYLEVDDTANQAVSAANHLALKGSFSFDATLRVLTLDPTWPDPPPLLHDDGSWMDGGHEPEGAAAGDHRWGLAVWIPNTSGRNYEYVLLMTNAVSGTELPLPHSDGDFFAQLGATAPVKLTYVLPAFGTVDVRVSIDVSDSGARLQGPFRGRSYSSVRLGSTALNVGWVDLRDDGLHGDDVASDGVYTLVFSEVAGPAGLVHPGDAVSFEPTLDGLPYWETGPLGTFWLTAGVSAAVRTGGGPWSPQPIVSCPTGACIAVP
ncbi:MAG: hypothetical protein QM704_05475 [Anaeromyxobacteraceae bacterium]